MSSPRNTTPPDAFVLRFDTDRGPRCNVRGPLEALKRAGIVPRDYVHPASGSSFRYGARMADGRISLYVYPDSDTRFRAALDRVISGGPCPDFELPLARKRKRLEWDDGEAA